MAMCIFMRDLKVIFKSRHSFFGKSRLNVILPYNPCKYSVKVCCKSVGMVEVKDAVSLLPEEDELFKILLESAKHSGSGTTLRCAGGWVRDKLLGKNSPDIDIALDNMLGREFAEKVNDYLKSQGKDVRTAAVIQSNPDQSKHLETARMKINNFWIDLVNLRSETYAANSRIPVMEFGTPEQDALRRDFTINALFYNLNESSVEDFTGSGLDDLRAGIIRTPLPASQTFMDDPLRVLRAVRFASRFGFELDPSLVEAASAEEVRVALASKISRERIGTELEGMFHGPSPVAAVQLLQRFGIFASVFSTPESVRPLLGSNWVAAATTTMAAAAQLAKAVLGDTLEKDDRRVLLLAALLLPTRNVPPVPAVTGKPVPLSSHIVREGLKWRGRDGELVVALHEAAPKLLELLEKLQEGSAGDAPEEVRTALGLLVRGFKQQWKLGMLIAPLLTTRSAALLDESTRASSPKGADFSADCEEAQIQKMAEMSRTLMSAVQAFGLEGCWEWKPLVAGPQVIKALGLKGGGPQVGKAMNITLEWQLAHPQGSAEKCLEHIVAKMAKA